MVYVVLQHANEPNPYDLIDPRHFELWTRPVSDSCFAQRCVPRSNSVIEVTQIFLMPLRLGHSTDDLTNPIFVLEPTEGTSHFAASQHRD